MNQVGHILYSTAYLAPVSYYASMVSAGQVTIEAHAHYTKQTYRNRCSIVTANGFLDLIIPVIKVNGNHTKIKDIRISYAEKWQNLHWRAIVSAYNHSPYFLYYREELAPFYRSRFDLLADFNSELLQLMFGLLGMTREIQFTSSYAKNVPGQMTDCRKLFSPKSKNAINFPEYCQVFKERFGFYSNLSIIDLLFNLGPEAKNYLLKLSL